MSGDDAQSVHQLRLFAQSNADEMGFLGQLAVADAVQSGDDYRIVGGHMVRLLLELYPAAAAVLRATLDADAAVDKIEVIGPLVANLLSQDFVKAGGNVFRKQVNTENLIEINLLLSRSDHRTGLHPLFVDGVGQVDSLPELSWAMLNDPLVLDVIATFRDGSDVTYRTRVPDVEVAVVLKAHAWHARHLSSDKDLADLSALFEIRHAHPNVAWRLDQPKLISFRRDAARILHELADSVTRKVVRYRVPPHVDRKRLAALIRRYITRV